MAIEDKPRPRLRDEHDVIVHVSQTGICGSDVSFGSARVLWTMTLSNTGFQIGALVSLRPRLHLPLAITGS